MRTLLALIILAVLFMPCAEAEEAASEFIAQSGLEKLQEFSGSYGTEVDVNEIAQNAARGEIFRFEELLPSMRAAASGAVKDIFGALSGMTGPVLLLALIGCVFPGGNGGVGGARFLLVLSLVGMMSGIALTALNSAAACMDTAQEFTDAASPVLASLAGAAGMNTSAALVTPASALAANIVEILFSKYGSFACRFALILAACGGISAAVDLSAAVAFMRKGVNWCCGLVGTLFAALISMQNSIAAAADNAAVRTAKYTVDSLASFIGSGVSDAWGTYVSGVTIAKNAVGVSGAAVLIAAGLRPVIRIAASMIALKLVQVFLSAVGEVRAATAAEQLAGVCQMALALSCGAITVAAVLCGAFMLAGKGLIF